MSFYTPYIHAPLQHDTQSPEQYQAQLGQPYRNSPGQLAQGSGQYQAMGQHTSNLYVPQQQFNVNPMQQAFPPYQNNSNVPLNSGTVPYQNFTPREPLFKPSIDQQQQYMYGQGVNSTSYQYKEKAASVGNRNRNCSAPDRVQPERRNNTNVLKDTTNSSMEDKFKAKASQYGIHICTKAENTAMKLVADAEATRKQKENDTKEKKQHVDNFLQKAMNCGIQIGSEPFVKPEIKQEQNSTNSKTELKDSDVNDGGYQTHEDHAQDLKVEKLETSWDKRKDCKTQNTSTNNDNSINIGQDSGTQAYNDKSETPDGIQGNLVLEMLKSVCSSSNKNNLPNHEKVLMKNITKSKDSDVKTTKNGDGTSLEIGESTDVENCESVDEIQNGDIHEEEPKFLDSFDGLVNDFVERIIKNAVQQLALQKCFKKQASELRKSSKSADEVSSSDESTIPDVGKCEKIDPESVDFSVNDYPPDVLEDKEAPIPYYDDNQQYKLHQLYSDVDETADNSGYSTPNNESMKSNLNPGSPEFKPGALKFLANGGHFVHDKSKNTFMRAEAPVFRPATSSSVPFSEPSFSLKSVKDKIVQTESKDYSDVATNTKRVKSVNVTTETASCDSREVCINTEESLFTEDSDFYTAVTTYNSQSTNTEAPQTVSVGVTVKPAKQEGTATKGTMTEPVDTYQRLLSTQRELLHLRGQVCIMELKRQLGVLEQNKDCLTNNFLSVDNISIEAVINARISALRSEMDCIQSQILKYDKELDEGNTWERVPQFSLSIPIGESGVRVVNNRQKDSGACKEYISSEDNSPKTIAALDKIASDICVNWKSENIVNHSPREEKHVSRKISESFDMESIDDTVRLDTLVDSSPETMFHSSYSSKEKQSESDSSLKSSTITWNEEFEKTLMCGNVSSSTSLNTEIQLDKKSPSLSDSNRSQVLPVPISISPKSLANKQSSDQLQNAMKTETLSPAENSRILSVSMSASSYSVASGTKVGDIVTSPYTHPQSVVSPQVRTVPVLVAPPVLSAPRLVPGQTGLYLAPAPITFAVPPPNLIPCAPMPNPRMPNPIQNEIGIRSGVPMMLQQNYSQNVNQQLVPLMPREARSSVAVNSTTSAIGRQSVTTDSLPVNMIPQPMSNVSRESLIDTQLSIANHEQTSTSAIVASTPMPSSSLSLQPIGLSASAIPKPQATVSSISTSASPVALPSTSPVCLATTSSLQNMLSTSPSLATTESSLNKLPDEVDPTLYEAVLTQLKQAYPQLIHDAKMLHSIALQQTQVLLGYINAGKMSGGMGLPNLGNIQATSLELNTDLKGVVSEPSSAEAVSSTLKRPPGLGDPDVSDTVPVVLEKPRPKINLASNSVSLDKKINNAISKDSASLDGQHDVKTLKNKEKPCNIKPRNLLDNFTKVEPPTNVTPKVSTLPADDVMFNSEKVPYKSAKDSAVTKSVVSSHVSSSSQMTNRHSSTQLNQTFDGPNNLPPRLQNRSKKPPTYQLSDINTDNRNGVKRTRTVSDASGENWDDDIDPYDTRSFKLGSKANIPKKTITVLEATSSKSEKDSIAEISDISLPTKNSDNVEEDDNEDDWQQVSKKKKKQETLTMGKKRQRSGDTGTTIGSQSAAISKARSNNFEKLVNKLCEVFKRLTRSEVIQVITEVRSKRGGLSGLTMEKIIEIAREVIDKKISLSSSQKSNKPLDAKSHMSSLKQGLLPTPGTKQSITAGLTKSTLSLPGKTFNFSKPLSMSVLPGVSDNSAHFQDDIDICVICHDDLSMEETKTLDCGHIFHTECIKQWVLGRERTCPNCRRLALFPEEFPRLGK